MQAPVRLRLFEWLVRPSRHGEWIAARFPPRDIAERIAGVSTEAAGGDKNPSSSEGFSTKIWPLGQQNWFFSDWRSSSRYDYEEASRLLANSR